MRNNYNGNLGDEIKDIIQDVLNTNNFSRLNQDIDRTVNSALRDLEGVFGVKGGFKEPDILHKPLSKEEPTHYENSKNEYKKAKYNKTDYASSKYNNTNYSKVKYNYSKSGMDLSLTRNIPGNVSGTLLTVFGFLGVGTFSLMLLGFILAVILTPGALFSVVSLAIPIPFLIASIIMASKGVEIRKRIGRFKRYVMRINGRKYCDIDELSQSIGKSEKFVANDIQKMIYLGMFPFGHLDEKKTCLMLDDETYKQYLETQRWAKEQQVEKAHQSNTPESEDEKQQRITIEEGKNYIKQIRAANDAIPGEEVSAKLDRLEVVTSKIFKHIEKNPEQITEIRKFMNYYLPTTLKLTEAYAELDKQQVSGENISTAKNEIQKTLDTINKAFENMLDDLFYHAAMDISSDISVLETMLAQEGLTDTDFKVNKKDEIKS